MLAAAPIQLAPNMLVKWIWAEPPGVIPRGLALSHETPDGKHCECNVLWDRLDGFSLESLDPVEVMPGVVCPDCPLDGVIYKGKWIEAP